MVATNAELMGETLQDIADAIREKRNVFYDISMLDMAREIRQINTDSDAYIMVRLPMLASLSQIQQEIFNEPVNAEYVIESSLQALPALNEINVFIDEE